MNIDRILDVRPDAAETPVTVKRCGNVIEVRYMRSTLCTVIEKASVDLYADKRTGEVKEFCHSANCADSKASVAQSLRKPRDLINVNLTAPEAALWVMLIYKEDIRDERRAYEDSRRFWQRLRYYLKKYEYRLAKYIMAAEPQGRGAWHLHCLFLFLEKVPFIPNVDIARIRGHGFTKTRSLQGIDNPGLYLTAYLGDMELSGALRVRNVKGQIAETKIVGTQGKRRKKTITKGVRLHLCPPGSNLYRANRDVKRLEMWQTAEAEAQALVCGASLTYEKTISVTDEAGAVKNIINYRQYNSAPKEGGQLDAARGAIPSKDT